jgi:hypothetical protein
MIQDVTRGRLNRLFKYFRNTPVVFRYVYNDSLGGHWTREEELCYDTFEIIGDDRYFNVVCRQGTTIVWEQSLDVWWEFYGLGKLRGTFGGPACLFSITRRYGVLKSIIHVLNAKYKGS